MKVETRNNLKVAFIVLLLMAVSLTLFYFKHTTLSIYFSLIGIPILLAAYSFSFVKARKKTGKDPGVILKEDEVRRIISDYQGLYERLNDMQQKYGINISSLKSDLEGLVKNDFPGVGISVKSGGHSENINFDENVIAKKEIAVLEKISDKLNGILKRSDEAFRNYTQSLSKNLLSLLEDLRDSGYDVEQDINALRDKINTHTLSQRMEDNLPFINSLDSAFNASINSCIDSALRLKSSVAAMNKDVSSIEKDIEEIKAYGNRRNYAERTKTLKNIMSKLDSLMSGDFEETKSESLNAIQLILDSIKGFEDENQMQLIELQSKVSRLNSPSKISELKNLRSRIIPISTCLINEIQNNIVKNESEIRKNSVPADFYYNDSSYAEELKSVLQQSTLTGYVDSYAVVAKKMIKILENSREKAGIISAYSKVKRKILKELERGTVDLKDLDLKKPEEFIGLLTAEIPDVWYDSINQTLKLRGGRPVYSLKIKVTAEAGKDRVKKAEIQLNQGSRILGKELSDAQGEVFFKDIPKGECTISMVMDGYRKTSQKVILEKDETIEILLKKIPLGEKLCGGKEESLRKMLRISENELSSLLQENFFVTSNADLKLKTKTDSADYIPCLLFLWSQEKENLKFIEGEGGIYLVYDKKHALAELKNILKMESGSRENITGFRDYFSAPLPEEEISALMDELKKESELIQI